MQYILRTQFDGIVCGEEIVESISSIYLVENVSSRVYSCTVVHQCERGDGHPQGIVLSPPFSHQAKPSLDNHHDTDLSMTSS